jgi:hypothetical protein
VGRTVEGGGVTRRWAEKRGTSVELSGKFTERPRQQSIDYLPSGPSCCFQSHKPPNALARAVLESFCITEKDRLCVVAHERASEATCREEQQQYRKTYADSIYTQQTLILYPRYHSTLNANPTQHNPNASSKPTQILGRAPAAP